MQNIKLVELVNKVDEELTAAGILHGIFSGMHAVTLAHHRTTADVDIWIDHRKIDALKKLYSNATVIPPMDNEPDSIHIVIGKDNEVEMVADGGLFRMTKLMSTHLNYMVSDGLSAWFVAPEDTIIFKALKQRGERQGKNDITDIIAIKDSVSLDTLYIRERAIEQGILDKIEPTLRQLGILQEESFNN